ncbi:MAG: DUF1302 family protein [Micropepsaceae bacterium]
MSTKLQRAGLLGTVAALSLLAVTGARAVETKFGDVDIVFDTTVSFGASMRTADRETAFLPEGNGGPVDPRTSGFTPIIVPVIPTYSGNTASATYTLNPDNFDGSSNGDDGRLNFDNGDLIGTTFKATHDLQMTWQNYKLFARALGFYDPIMNDNDVGARSELTDAALGDVGRNYELLDLFISADYTIAEMPVNLRVGKQVINWGESTFLLNGNNVFNPIDVGAFRRPGSEIKEALVPVNAISGSISLPFDVSFSAYYALDFEPFEIDPSGTPFSGADVVALGSGIGGNQDRVSLLSSSPLTGMRRNCTAGATTGTRAVQTNGLLNDPTVAQAGQLDCTDDNTFTGIFANAIDYTQFYTIGQAERTRLGLADSLASQGASRETFGLIDFGGPGEDAVNDDNQYGLSARYYAEDLNGTEFGFYFQNYHSRLPFISERIGGNSTIAIAVNGASAQATAGGAGGRNLLPAGCNINPLAPPGSAAVMGATATATAQGVNAAFGDAGAPDANGIGLDDTIVNDPQDLINAALATTISTLTGGQLTLSQSASGSYDTVLNVMKLNCMLSWYQSQTLDLDGAGPNAPLSQLLDGAETIGLNPNIDLLVEYPEDIRVWGFSFNTTLLGWGVQGDFTYRPDAPFQIDTDSLTIAGAWKSCAFQTNTAGASVTALLPLRTPDGSGLQPQCLAAGGVGLAAGQSEYIKGWLENEMYTAQIGTTATFTGSDWLIEAIDADLGILVSEFGMVYVPGVEDSYLSVSALNRNLPVFGNTGCQASDLPLGGLLALDSKLSSQCRPTDWSAGLVLLYRVEYNNAFDTGFTIAPQIVYSYDFEGTTPSPYGNYMEDRQTIGLSLTGTLNNNFRVGATYSNFFGGHITNKAKDTDFASISASYTF